MSKDTLSRVFLKFIKRYFLVLIALVVSSESFANASTPIVKKSIPDQVVYKGQMFDLSFNTYDIFDSPGGDDLSITIENADGTPLPIWLKHVGPNLLEVPKISGARTRGVAISGSYIYLAAGQFLLVFFVDNNIPPTIRLFGSCRLLSDPRKLKVVGDYVYLVGEELQIVDISNSSTPTLVGQYKPQPKSEEFAEVSDYAYVLYNQLPGAQIVNYNPSSDDYGVISFFSSFSFLENSPIQTNLLVENELRSINSIGITVVGDYAYIASGCAGLQIIDVSIPSDPRLVAIYDGCDGCNVDVFGTEDLECSVFEVDVSGNYAYLVVLKVLEETVLKTGIRGGLIGGQLLIIDVSTPSSPHLVGSLDLPDIASDVVVVDDYAYVTNRKVGLQIIDIKSPSEPYLVGTLNLRTEGLNEREGVNVANSIYVIDDYAYVADCFEGLKIIDISKPSQPRLIGKRKTKDCALDVVVGSDHAYVADQWGGLQVIENITGKKFTLCGTSSILGRLNLKVTASNGVNSVSTIFSIDVQDVPSQLDEEDTEEMFVPVDDNIFSGLFMEEEESLSSALEHSNDHELTELHIAVGKGLKRDVKNMLEHGADVNKLNNDGFSSLHIAISNAQEKIAQLLVKFGADVNVADKNFGLSLLHLVALYDFVKLISSTINKLEEYEPKFLSRLVKNCHYCENQNLVRFLDDIRVDLEIPVHNDISSLINDAVTDIKSVVNRERYGNHGECLDVVRYHSPFLANVNTKCNYCKRYNLWRDMRYDKMKKMPTKNEISLLHFAALTGQVETIKLLISKVNPLYLESYINSADNLGRTALHFAAQVGSAEATTLLIENGANVNVEKIYINNIVKGLDSPLHIASRHGYVDVAMILINNGADVNAKFYPGMPLHEAAAGGYADIAKALIDRGATVDVKNSLGNTSLHVASRLGHAGVVKVLIDGGADVNKEAVFSNSGHIIDVPPLYYLEDVPPLYMASAGGHTEVIKLLIDAGANLPDSARFSGLKGEELVEELVNFGLSSFVESLIESKQLDVNVANYNLYVTPLHTACEQGDIETVKVLIKHGANLHAVAHNGDTVLIAAARQNDPELVKILVEAGVDIDKQNRFRWSPLYVAASYGNIEVVSYLLQVGAKLSRGIEPDPSGIAGSMDYNEIVSLIREFNPRYSHSKPKSLSPKRPLPNFADTSWEYEQDNSKYAPFPSKQCKDWLEPTYQYYVGNGCSFMVHDVVGFKVTPSDDYERCDLHNEYLQVNLIESALSQANPFDKLRCLIEIGYDAQIALNFVYNAGGISAGKVFMNNAKAFIDTINFLIDKGADINKVGTNSESWRTPLISLLRDCCSYADDKYNENDDAVEEKVRFLLEAGADPNYIDKEGDTVLYYVFTHGIKDTQRFLNLLLEYGADINLANQDGNTLLSRVSGFSSYSKEFIPMIVEAKANINQEDKKGDTPLHKLLNEGKRSDADVLKYLISMGADVNRSNVEGITPLHITFSSLYDDYGMNHGHWRPSRAEVLETLMNAGADINPAVKDGSTPFKPSFQRYDTKLIQLLVDLGIDVNLATKRGITPLHMFTRLGNLEAVKVLIEAGADVTKKDDRGLTPLDIAYEEGYDEIVKALSVCVGCH